MSYSLKQDNFNKENLYLLRTFFISCSFSDEGLCPTVEFEEKIKKANTTLSWSTIDQLIALITSKRDKSKVSYFKLKNLIKYLENDQLYKNMHSSTQVKKLITDPFEGLRAPITENNELQTLRNEKSENAQIGDRTNQLWVFNKFRLHSYLNQIELRLEEKFKTIAKAFRTFDSDGDSRITFEEFWIGLDQVGIAMKKDTCKELFDYLDENKDEHIEFNEF